MRLVRVVSGCVQYILVCNFQNPNNHNMSYFPPFFSDISENPFKASMFAPLLSLPFPSPELSARRESGCFLSCLTGCGCRVRSQAHARQSIGLTVQMAPRSVLAFAGAVPLGLHGATLGKSSVRPSVAAPARCASRTIVRAVVTGDASVAVNGLEDSVSSESSISSFKEVEAIIELAKEFELADLRLVDNGVTVEISMPGGRGFKDGALKEIPQPPAAPATSYVQAPVAYETIAEAPIEDEEEEEFGDDEDEEADSPAMEEADEDGIYPSDFVVTSNRVGFFFSGGKGKPPLANVDDHVAFNQPVCIIEQLGQQYVYLAEVSGTVVKILVEDGDPIMYGTKVMVIRPD